MSKLKTGLFIGGFVAFTAAAMVPVFVYPRLHPEVYSTCQLKLFFVKECEHSFILGYYLKDVIKLPKAGAWQVNLLSSNKT